MFRTNFSLYVQTFHFIFIYVFLKSLISMHEHSQVITSFLLLFTFYYLNLILSQFMTVKLRQKNNFYLPKFYMSRCQKSVRFQGVKIWNSSVFTDRNEKSIIEKFKNNLRESNQMNTNYTIYFYSNIHSDYLNSPKKNVSLVCAVSQREYTTQWYFIVEYPV